MEHARGERGRVGGRRARLLVSGLLLLPVVAAAQGEGPKSPPGGSGFLFGAAVGGGRLGFPGGEGLVLALGPAASRENVAGTGEVRVRGAKVVRAGEAPAGAEILVPLPAGEGAGGFSMHGGYAFNRRVAVLLDVGVSGGLSTSDFNHAVGSLLVRLWPTSRLWVEAGPAFGDLGFGSEGSVVRSGSITGAGFQGVAGVSVLRKPRWSFDVEARYGRIGYDGFSATTFTLGFAASRLPAY